MSFDIDYITIPPLRVFHQKMEASLYNTIRLGILRIENPLIFTLKERPNIKCYLSDSKWIFFHRTRIEFPIAVWREFNLRNRSLHEPVNCKVYIYHIMAGWLMGPGLYAVEAYLNKRLAPNDKDSIVDT